MRIIALRYIRMMNRPTIAPSILAADPLELGAGIDACAGAGADLIHVDVMDGLFVPPISFGEALVERAAGRTKLPLDVHLMTLEPDRKIDAFAKAGATYLTFHLEACVHAHRILLRIREKGLKAGISICPSTPAQALEPLLGYADLVLVMTVDPGYGGQSMIRECLDKVKALAGMRAKGGHGFLLSVDGGVTTETAPLAIAAGADILVTGSAFFRAQDRAASLKALRGRAAG